MSLPFLFSGCRPSVRILSLVMVVLTLAATELCYSAEINFGGNYSVQLPANWTAKLQKDKSFVATAPGFWYLNAYVVSTERSPEQLMAKVTTDILEKKAGFKLLEKGSLKNNAGRQAHFMRYQRSAKTDLVWIDYFFQLANKAVVVLTFAFPEPDSESAKSDIEAIFNSVKVGAAASDPQDSRATTPVEK